MKLLTVGLNHKTSTIETREKFFLTPVEIELLLGDLKNDPAVMSAMILSTCNRTEIYTHIMDDGASLDVIKKLFRIKQQPLTEDLQKLFYVLEGELAVKHLLEVACGLDSLILGEKQILGQIKDAIELAQKSTCMDKFLNILTQFVLETGKKARRDTHIDVGGSSIGWAAVMMAQNILGSLEDKSVLILGSGKMGRLTVQQLRPKGVKKVYIINRTFEKAEDLAKHHDAESVPFWQMKDILPQVDACICSVSCPHYLIDKDLVHSAMAGRAGQKLVLIDISVPRTIDPQAASVPGVSLVAVDDLDRVVYDNIQKREGAAKQVEKIIANKVQEFFEDVHERRLMEHADH